MNAYVSHFEAPKPISVPTERGRATFYELGGMVVAPALGRSLNPDDARRWEERKPVIAAKAGDVTAAAARAAIEPMLLPYEQGDDHTVLAIEPPPLVKDDLNRLKQLQAELAQYPPVPDLPAADQ